MSGPTIIEASDIACASAAADLFGGNGLNTTQQVLIVANLFAEHREKAERQLKERSDVLASIEVWLAKEYQGGDKRSDDLLDDFVAFFEHHKRKEAQVTALRTALLDVMETERLRYLAHQKWQSAQEDERYIAPMDYERAKAHNSSACAAHHDALNKARALLVTP